MMNRRNLVVQATLALGLVLSNAAWSQVGPLRISTAAADTDWLSKSLVMFKDTVEKALPGQVTVQVHAASSLFRQGTEVPALQRGNLEMSTMTTFEIEQQIPEYGVLSAGYLFRDYDHLSKVFKGAIGKDYFDAVAQKMSVQIIGTAYLGTRQLNLRVAKDVKTPADLAGVKLRLPGGPGWMAMGKGLGVSPTPMGMPEVYLALKTGAVDGQDNPLNITKVNNLHEVTQQIVLTSHMLQPVFFAVAKPYWDKLSAPQQAVLRKAAAEATEFNDRSRLAEEKDMVDFFVKAGLKVTTPDIGAFRASVEKQYTEAGLSQKWAPGLMEKIGAVR
jgi:TRAP-type transport system periplasmic protein